MTSSLTNSRQGTKSTPNPTPQIEMEITIVWFEPQSSKIVLKYHGER